MGKPFAIPPWGAVATTGPMIEIDPASDKARLPPAPTPPGGGDAAPPG